MVLQSGDVLRAGRVAAGLSCSSMCVLESAWPFIFGSLALAPCVRDEWNHSTHSRGVPGLAGVAPAQLCSLRELLLERHGSGKPKTFKFLPEANRHRHDGPIVQTAHMKGVVHDPPQGWEHRQMHPFCIARCSNANAVVSCRVGVHQPVRGCSSHLLSVGNCRMGQS